MRRSGVRPPSAPPRQNARLSGGWRDAAASAGARSAPMRELAGEPESILRHRPFVLYWSARTCASMGYQMLGVAVAWQMYALTGSAFDLGLVGLVQFLPAPLSCWWRARSPTATTAAGCCASARPSRASPPR